MWTQTIGNWLFGFSWNVVISEWEGKESGEKLTTFSIDHRPRYDLLARIHHNPKIEWPRMPSFFGTMPSNTWITENVESEANH